ncbi:hypothetical protein M3Y99_00830100 [Aphelenchoides fujianensis]|nr:hypothetical protein M3Y99_00830100 [Aphelenchoides fujianensis]
MGDADNQSALLLTVHSVVYRGADVESEKIDFPYSPGTKFSLVVTKPADSLVTNVKIGAEGSVESLHGAIWVENHEGRNSIPRWEARFNTNYPAALSLNDRVFCCVWIKECSFCKEADHEKVLESLRSQLEQSERRLAEQRLQAENSQKALESRIHQLEREGADNKRKLTTAVEEDGPSIREKKERIPSSVYSLVRYRLDVSEKIVRMLMDVPTAGGPIGRVVTSTPCLPLGQLPPPPSNRPLSPRPAPASISTHEPVDSKETSFHLHFLLFLFRLFHFLNVSTVRIVPSVLDYRSGV